MSIAPGTKLGQYEVQDFIGQGAMGLVFRAYHVQLQRTGAVKVLQGIAPDPDSTARFRHEAQAIAQMRHPNIVGVYDFGEHEGTPYMIIEYVPGGSLATRLNGEQLEPGAALKYLRGIAAGLDYAHGLGIVHRDVKPANVLLEKDDTPVLADFGLAKLLQGSSLKSMTGVTTGTPAYMAPEQVTGSRVGPAADRYALATIAYEMLTGVIPFDGEGLLELLYAHVHREPPPPSTRNSSLGPRVDAVIMRGLAKDPSARWESCSAMVDALSAALTHRPEPVARTMVMTPVPSATPFAAPEAATLRAPAAYVDAEDSIAAGAGAYPSPPQPPAQRKSHKGRIAVAIAAALIVLLVIGVAGYLSTRPPPALSLTPSTVTAGETVLVTISHLPANQSGEIRLHSATQVFPFHANSNGDVSQYITVPRDAGVGDHTVEICWASSCHVTVKLRVLEPVTLVTPSPSPSPSPSPRATPTPTPQPVVILLSISATGSFTVRLQYFSVGTPAKLVVFQKDVSHFAGNITVTSTDFRATVRTPPGIVAGLTALVVACDNVSGPCRSSQSVIVGP